MPPSHQITSIPRFLLPRGLSPLRLPPRRHASTSPSASKPPKSNILEKPSKFNPPSHPSRYIPTSKPRPQIPRQYPGPPVSAAEKEIQRTRKYPNMFPPKGTRMHWFLTNKTIHICITLAVLFSCGVTAVLQNFYFTSPFAADLPAPRAFLTNPIESVAQFIHVYKIHVEYRSAETADRRRRKVEDVQKMSEFRRAHGLETKWGEGEGLGGWTSKREGETLGSGIDVEDRDEDEGKEVVGVGEGVVEGEKGVYRDWEGRKRPVKKWLGIW